MKCLDFGCFWHTKSWIFTNTFFEAISSLTFPRHFHRTLSNKKLCRTPKSGYYHYPVGCLRLTRRSTVARLLVVLVEKACGLPLPPQQALPVPPAAFAGRSGRRWCFRSRRSFCSKKHREEVGADTSYPRAFHERGAFYSRLVFLER